MVDLAPTADGKGYWLVGSDGGIFAFGDARFHGSMGGRPLNAAGGRAGRRQRHRRLLAGRVSDGGIFAFDAPFHGSAGDLVLNAPVNGMAATSNGQGLLVGRLPTAPSSRSATPPSTAAPAAMPLNAPMVGMAADRATGGYWLVGADGGIFAFDAPFFGPADPGRRGRLTPDGRRGRRPQPPGG